MVINFTELESALYHIRVNYFGCDAEGLSVQLRGLYNGDTLVVVWNDRNKKVGEFFLSVVIEEVALLREGKIDFCDLSANDIEDDEED